jgi:hypothetical protein
MFYLENYKELYNRSNRDHMQRNRYRIIKKSPSTLLHQIPKVIFGLILIDSNFCKI